MKKFNIWASTSASMALGEFEAETEEEAIDMAVAMFGEKSASLCHRCARDIDLGDFEIGEDGVEEIT